jgi:hypothetical protein
MSRSSSAEAAAALSSLTELAFTADAALGLDARERGDFLGEMAE